MSSRGAHQEYLGQAAILLAVAGEGEQQRILLTKRAEHLNIHKGEVAFPGGKWEPGDANLLATALRESREEVSLKEDEVKVIGQLDICYTRAGMPVTPFVAQIAEDLDLRPNTDELDALFWVPLGFFLKDQRERTDIFIRKDREDWAPVYHYSGFKIWGFTARVIVEFANTYCGVCIRREHSAPEVEFRRA